MPKKKFIDDFRAHPDDVDKVNQKMSIAYLLMSRANADIEEAEEVLHSYNLTLGDIKREASLIRQHFERYNSLLRQLIIPTEKQNCCSDYAELDDLLTRFEELKS